MASAPADRGNMPGPPRTAYPDKSAELEGHVEPSNEEHDRPLHLDATSCLVFRSRRPLIDPSLPAPVLATVEDLINTFSRPTLEPRSASSASAAESHTLDEPPASSRFGYYPLHEELGLDPSTESPRLVADQIHKPSSLSFTSSSNHSRISTSSPNATLVPNTSSLAPSVTSSAALGNEQTRSPSSRNRILDMIKSQSQCTVNSTPPALPVPTPVSLPPVLSSDLLVPPPPFPIMPEITIDMDMDMEVDMELKDPACLLLEVDESPDAGHEASFMEAIVASRRAAAATGGVKKNGLRYRTSHETALRCSTLVRNVPMMRRRKHKTRPRGRKEVASTADRSVAASSTKPPPSTTCPA